MHYNTQQSQRATMPEIYKDIAILDIKTCYKSNLLSYCQRLEKKALKSLQAYSTLLNEFNKYLGFLVGAKVLTIKEVDGVFYPYIKSLNAKATKVYLCS